MFDMFPLLSSMVETGTVLPASERWQVSRTAANWFLALACVLSGVTWGLIAIIDLFAQNRTEPSSVSFPPHSENRGLAMDSLELAGGGD